MSERIGVFPGSFDPLHNGHYDLIQRAVNLFDRLYVAVLNNEAKSPLFTVEERIEMLEELLVGQSNCSVESFSGLLVDYAASRRATAIVRGLRTTGDFDYELPMTLMNRRLQPTVETLFLMPRSDCIFLSSRLIKEVCSLSGDVGGLVPDPIAERLMARLGVDEREAGE